VGVGVGVDRAGSMVHVGWVVSMSWRWGRGCRAPEVPLRDGGVGEGGVEVTSGCVWSGWDKRGSGLAVWGRNEAALIEVQEGGREGAVEAEEHGNTVAAAVG